MYFLRNAISLRCALTTFLQNYIDGTVLKTTGAGISLNIEPVIRKYEKSYWNFSRTIDILININVVASSKRLRI